MQYWRYQKKLLNVKVSIPQEWIQERKKNFHLQSGIGKSFLQPGDRRQHPASPSVLFTTYLKQVSLSVQECVHRQGADHGVATDVTWIAFHCSELIGQELTKIEEGSKNGLPVVAGTSSLHT